MHLICPLSLPPARRDSYQGKHPAHDKAPPKRGQGHAEYFILPRGCGRAQGRHNAAPAAASSRCYLGQRSEGDARSGTDGKAPSRSRSRIRDGPSLMKSAVVPAEPRAVASPRGWAGRHVNPGVGVRTQSRAQAL
jgi:hypothetical protein